MTAISMEYAWDGTAREPVLIIYDNGSRVASFEDEVEALQWIADEYGIDPDSVEVK